jgi:hypothetical protein
VEEDKGNFKANRMNRNGKRDKSLVGKNFLSVRCRRNASKERLAVMAKAATYRQLAAPTADWKNLRDSAVSSDTYCKAASAVVGENEEGKEGGDGVRDSPPPFAREEVRRGNLLSRAFQPCALVFS